jgi:ATP-dependent DNA helicase RecQ
LIGFVYQEIALKREAAIDAMEEACEIGVRQGDGAFRDFLAVYFSSKYYPLLVVDTESGKRAEFTTVWKYAKLTEGNIDNLKHLRGACVRLLTENPENGALLLLKSFAILSAAKQKYFLAEAIDEAMRGFKSFKKIQGIKFDEFLEAVERFQTILLTYSRTHMELISEMADLLLLNHHREWLQEFNNKVLRPS